MRCRSEVGQSRLTHCFWEAKDIRGALPREARKRFDLGYPGDNILFQTPRRALLFQNDSLAFDADLTQPAAVIDALASRSFSRTEFLKKLDRFYPAIEHAVAMRETSRSALPHKLAHELHANEIMLLP